MGALTPLDNSSLSFELVQTISESNQNPEYSLFSEYLSPLSQNTTQENQPGTPLPENTFNSADSEKANEFKLFAPSEEPAPKKRPKLFADRTSKTKESGQQNKPSSSADNQKNGSTIESKEPQSKPNTITQKASGISSGEELLVNLKENVKNILKNIPTTPSAAQKTTKGKSILPKGVSMRIENVAEFQLTTANPTKKGKSQSQTTVAHLSTRNKPSASGNEQNNQPLVEGTQQNVKSTQKDVQQKLPSVQQHISQDPHFNLVHKKARTVKKGRTEQRSAINQKGTQNTSNKESTLPRFVTLDKIADGQANPLMSSEKVDIQRQQIDTSSQDADANPNHLGKGTSKADASKATGAKTQQTTRASRATNWLKTLSERTSLLDKTNPKWKVLEMKLENGNGNMTVRVMREDDHVSVAVNFSDPEVKALAETQYHEILRDLEQQYQQEVKFSFNEQNTPSFESLFLLQCLEGPMHGHFSNLLKNQTKRFQKNSPAFLLKEMCG